MLHDIKVFGIGLQKTGTTTLGLYLKSLGYKHKSYDNEAIWMLRKNKENKLKKIIQQYESFEDEPWAHLYKLEDNIYPNAKFILTVRKDAERWYESICNHCDRIPFNEHRKYFFSALLPRRHKEKYIETYIDHIKEVKEYFKDKPDKLLIVCWENGDGIHKIAKFLNKETKVKENLKKWGNKAPNRKYKELTYLKIIIYIPKYYYKRLKGIIISTLKTKFILD